MNALSKITPPNILLTKLSYYGELTTQGATEVTLKIDGYVLSTEAGGELSTVNKFVAQLSEDKEFMRGFPEIRVGRTSKDDVDNHSVVRFTLDCSKVRI